MQHQIFNNNYDNNQIKNNNLFDLVFEFNSISLIFNLLYLFKIEKENKSKN